MNKENIAKIIKINMDFYSRYEVDFSTSRQFPWKGWGIVKDLIVKEFKSYKNISVLDVGCGNGRFLRYLSQNIEKEITYTGVDTNEFLLEEGKSLFGNQTFIKSDFIKNPRLKGEFDIVVCFGIAHHIPGNDFRSNWFENIAKLVKKKGLLVITLWNISNDTRFKPIVTSHDPILKDLELEDGDTFIGWNNETNFPRYVHTYSEREIDEILETLKCRGLFLVRRFSSDGRTGDLNIYLILQHKPLT